jgi:hypothetical protein
MFFVKRKTRWLVGGQATLNILNYVKIIKIEGHFKPYILFLGVKNSVIAIGMDTKKKTAL